MKNRIISIFLIVALCMSTLVGCGSATKKENDKFSVVCTIFPEYDWVKEILGEHADSFDITLLLDSGADLHSYQPTAQDMVKISDCDMFIYVGGESDQWVEDALKESTNKEMIVISLQDYLGTQIKEEEVKEGMEAEEEEEGEDEEEEEGPEYDEHVWLSLKNTQILVEAINDGICKVDEENADVYTANTESYVEKLKDLDAQYQQAVDEASIKTVLFGDRFPFRYLVDDYGLDYYAAFVGCSAETEASFETITFLAKKVDELKLPAVFTIESSDGKIAETIVDNTEQKDQKILVMDSMQSTTSTDSENGVTYMSIMEDNLSVLKDGLN